MQQRQVAISGAINFRDLGGYETKQGKRVKWGKLFRSGELSALTEADIILIKQLGIEYILDYRTQYEYDHNPDIEIEGVTHRLLPALDVDPANDPMFSKKKLIELKDLRFMQGEENPLLKHYRSPNFYSKNEAYRVLMDLIKSDHEGGILQHCTAGKDRTGLGAAIVLLTLEVPRETVIEDYMLTNHFRQLHTEKIIEKITPLLANNESIEVIRDLLEVREHYMEALLEGIENSYGNFENYLEQEYNINQYMRDKIKEKYLE